MPEMLTIAEDPRLAEQVRRLAARDTLGQAVIISGQGDLAAAARFFAAAMECTGEDRPCGCCAACRKVLRDIHPDVVTVTDAEHKNLSIEVLRQVRADAYILPNEGRRKVYIFPDCGRLEPKGQNVLLKVLEEGPPRAAFLLCAANSAVLLPTIRSRAAEWKLRCEAAAEPSDQRAEQLCRLLCRRKPAELAAFFTELENRKISREELQSLLSAAGEILTRGLAACYGGGGDELPAALARELGRKRLASTVELLREYTRQCTYNVNVGQVTGALTAALSM